jgi:pimeloyl-ACP methyl ester carboxylesterase
MQLGDPMSEFSIPETKFARSGDVSIAYQVFGSGARDLVFVPGVISNVEMAWEIPSQADFFKRLARNFRVITYDKRGQGLSDPMDRSLSLEERMDELHAVMDAAGCERVILTGLSDGASSTILFASTYPDRVEHLVLIGAYAVSGPIELGWSEDQANRMLDAVQAGWGTRDDIERLAPERVGDERFIRDHIRHARLCASPLMIRRAYETIFRIDLRAVLPDVQAPTLAIHQRRDQLVSTARGRYLADQIPNATYLELPGSSHVPWGSDFETIIGAIELFTATQAPAKPENTGRKVASAVFTDIQNSTELLSDMGDAGWREMLDRHDHIARALIDQHSGRLVKNTGDGCLAIFDGPTRAIRCASAMIGHLGEIGLTARAGVHSGEIETRLDGDVTGLAIHVAARVMEKASGGDLLVSRTARDLTAGSELEFAEAGTFELKGLPEAVTLYRPVGVLQADCG